MVVNKLVDMFVYYLSLSSYSNIKLPIIEKI